jgi:hypothetical protein
VVPLDRATVAYRLPDRRPADALHVMRESTEESYAELSAPPHGHRDRARGVNTPDDIHSRLAISAREVLQANWIGRYTVPSRRLYPHQWSWDSAFIALGLRHVDAARAEQELESLLSAQWADGRIPHIVFDPATPPDAYFPGPAFWRSADVAGSPDVATTGLVQPPVHAWAAWETFLADPDRPRARAFLARTYPKLVAWHAYLTRCRDAGGRGLVSLVHPWESGMDNSPAWDEVLRRVQPVPATELSRRDLTGTAALQERPTDVDYGRYIRLAGDYRDAGYHDGLGWGQFLVEDPLANALLAVSELALAAIAAEVGVDPAPHSKRAERVARALVEVLFDPQARMFFPRDLRTGALLRAYSVAGLAPLVVPGLPVAEDLLKTAREERFKLGVVHLVPSADLTAATFEPSRYWRGPAWYNTAWLIWRGLLEHREFHQAEALRESILATAEHSGFREYVDPLTGQGAGAAQFSWTAAVVLELLAEPRPQTWHERWMLDRR